MSVLLVLAAVSLLAVGCSDNDSDKITDSGQLGTSGVVLLMHDAPIDSLSEVWLTVNSIRLLTSTDDDADTTEVEDDSSDTSGTIALSEPVRMNLLALDSISRVLAVASAPAGVYGKIRLYVSDPLFVLDDATEIPAEQIKLVANGKVDLNPQGDVIVTTDAFTVVVLDLDVENSVQVNQTGSETYILRPQVFVDATVDSLERVELMGGVIASIDRAMGEITVGTPGSGETIVAVIDGDTELQDTDGSPLSISSISTGMAIDIHGVFDTKRLVVYADQITLLQ
ncbi:MAG: hypothetical protein Kow0074_16900 [Candidatus Zixiibacteriota bacterium]